MSTYKTLLAHYNQRAFARYHLERKSEELIRRAAMNVGLTRGATERLIMDVNMQLARAGEAAENEKVIADAKRSKQPRGDAGAADSGPEVA